MTGAFHEDQYTFFLSYLAHFFLRLRNASNKSCAENQNTHFTFSNFFSKNRAIYEIMWKNLVQPVRPQMAIWRMRIACLIPNAADTHTQNT